MTTIRLSLVLLISYVLAGIPADPTVPPGPPSHTLVPSDSLIAAAADALARGLPWRASRIIAPVLRDSAGRSPEAILLAASAADAWNGWTEVQRLLERETWLDTLFDGRARTLLARAALAEGQDSLALRHASAAARLDRTAAHHAENLVLLARALERIGGLDSARSAYLRAAALLPAVSDWLELRAAGATEDSLARAQIFSLVTMSHARDRIPATEAAAMERAGNLAGAALAYDSVGERTAAYRVRLAAASDSTKGELRKGLISLIADGEGSAQARQAVVLLDSVFTDLTAGEQLTVARSLVRSGPLSRAAAAFAAALEAKHGTGQDRFDYANILAKLGRHAEAADQFARVRTPRPLAADAAYLRIRSLVRGGLIADAGPSLRAIVKRFPKDTTAASSALFLLSDLATDKRRDREARASLRELARRYPTSRYVVKARFRAAIIAFADGQSRSAALELDSLRQRYPRSDEVLAATYWSGRAWAAAGDSARARSRWRDLLSRDPLSYYAAVAARQLDTVAWVPPTAPDSFPAVPAVDSAMQRALLLERLGMVLEARLEYDELLKNAEEFTARLLATANAFRTHGLASRAVQLGWRALGRGAPADARLYRLIYPLAHLEGILAEAEEQQLDPTLVAALIRQESSFNPSATSGAGARGLMQVMPDLGRGMARELGFPTWDPALLYQPDVSLQLGTIHLASLVRDYAEPARVLAAYNAGRSRVDRWGTKIGVDDAELFTERIPFAETRDYVRIVQRNQELYRALYEGLREKD